jgi:hypothetical protein
MMSKIPEKNKGAKIGVKTHVTEDRTKREYLRGRGSVTPREFMIGSASVHGLEMHRHGSHEDEKEIGLALHERQNLSG